MDERFVIFIDRDHTLFNQTRAFRKASTHGISTFDLRIPREGALQLHKTVVDHWKDYESMRLPNFKLPWNSPKLYAVLIILVAIGRKSQCAFEKAERSPRKAKSC